jgi:hypothetical protein
MIVIRAERMASVSTASAELIERKQNLPNLPNLAPQRELIAADPVEGAVQVGEPEEAFHQQRRVIGRKFGVGRVNGSAL